jgi:hypothetical protein
LVKAAAFDLSGIGPLRNCALEPVGDPHTFRDTGHQCEGLERRPRLPAQPARGAQARARVDLEGVDMD